MIKNIEQTKDGVSSLIDGARDAVVGVADHAERSVASAARRAVKGARVAGELVRLRTRLKERRAVTPVSLSRAPGAKEAR